MPSRRTRAIEPGLREDLATYGRYVRGLRSFLRDQIDRETARRRLREAVANREQSFLDVVRRAVFERPGCAYHALFEHAGIALGDVERLVEERGLEGALSELYEAGVYVTIDEFKGRRPIKRGSLERNVTVQDFDNPLVVRETAITTGGSGGAARSLVASFAMLEDYGLSWALVAEGHDLYDRPYGVWQPLPPSVSGISSALAVTKMGHPPARWFTQTELALRPAELRGIGLAATAWLAARAHRTPFGFPRHAAPDQPLPVARWLAEMRGAGTPAVFQGTPSSIVRVCSCALEAGLDISGTLFIGGGEPLTGSKAEIVEAAGCRAISPYGMSELGMSGVPCAAPSEVDEVHVVADSAAYLDRPAEHSSGATVDALYVSALLPGSPKTMINVESGDYGILTDRDCGCPLQELGHRVHLHTIRSYEKLTSEGMTVGRTDLVELIERELPSRFGGGPTDYQLIEEEADGVTKVRLVISPKVGPVDEGEAVEAVLTFIERGSRWEELMADVWRRSGALEVARREPYVTDASKTLTLHVVR